MGDTYPKKKYILVVHESGDDSAYIENGLYLVSSDKNGGWNDLQTRLALGNLKFKGETAPKKESMLLEKLRWKHSELVKNGHSCSIPSCITFTQFISELTTSGRIPSQPTSSFSAEENEVVTELTEAPPSVQNIFETEVDNEIEMLNRGADDSPQDEEENESAHFLPPGHGTNLPDGTVSKEDYDALNRKHNSLLSRTAEMENKIAIGQTDQASVISRSIKGFLDNTVKSLSSSIENTVRREVNSALADLGTDHLSGLHEKLANIESTATDNESSLRTVVSTQQIQQVSLDILVSNSKFLKAKAITTPTKTAAPAKPAAASVSLDDSGFAENWRSTPPPPPPARRCNFCNMVGHEWRNCRNRPVNYRCAKCLSAEHKETNCIPSRTPCDQCGALGHTKSVHALTDPQKRLNAILRFGADNFRHWSTGSEENTTWSASPRKKARNQ